MSDVGTKTVGTTDVRNIQLLQTWIEEKIESITSQYKYKEDKAFLSLAVSLIFDVGYDDIAPEELVDQSQDKQIDFIRIKEDTDGNFCVHIIQAKNTNSFESDVVIKIKNGLSWIFSMPKAEYKKLKNPLLVHKIDEIRKLRNENGADSITIVVYYVTKGDTTKLSEEFIQEQTSLEKEFAGSGFRNFIFKPVGLFELVELLNRSEQAKRKIDYTIPIVYSENKASIIEYVTEYKGEIVNAVICSVKGKDLAILASDERRDSIFDMNVRTFYGTKYEVNSNIYQTCTDKDESHIFWFLNNGITMICDKFSAIKDPDNPQVILENVQIVNGCQTTATIREAKEKGYLSDDVCVLLRIYATKNPNLVDCITLSTNSQNEITNRDLRANDSIQRNIQRVMQEVCGYYYERKNKEWRTLPSNKKNKIVPNEKAAQAYLAIVRKKPSIAKGYRGRIWDQHYSEIFQNATAESLLLAYKIYEECNLTADVAKEQDDIDPIFREVAVYGLFHIARVMGFKLIGDNWGVNKSESILSEIRKSEDDDKYLEDLYLDALEIVHGIRLKNIKEQPNPILYFKVTELQDELERALHVKAKTPTTKNKSNVNRSTRKKSTTNPAKRNTHNRKRSKVNNTKGNKAKGTKTKK